MKTRVFVLYTGGTIGMAPKDPADPYSPLEPKPLTEILTYIPGCSYTKKTQFRSTEAQELAAAKPKVSFLELADG